MQKENSGDKMLRRLGDIMSLTSDALTIVASVLIIKFLLETLKVIEALRTF